MEMRCLWLLSSRGTDALTCYFFRLQLDVGVDTCICGVDGEHELNVIHNTRVMQKKKKKSVFCSAEGGQRRRKTNFKLAEQVPVWK